MECPEGGVVVSSVGFTQADLAAISQMAEDLSRVNIPEDSDRRSYPVEVRILGKADSVAVRILLLDDRDPLIFFEDEDYPS